MPKIYADNRWVHVGEVRFKRELVDKGTRMKTERYVRSLIQLVRRSTYAEVSKISGLSSDLLQDICRASGLRKYPQKYGEYGTAWRIKEVKRLYEIGATDNEVAEQVGITRQSAHRIRHKLGLAIPNKKPPDCP